MWNWSAALNHLNLDLMAAAAGIVYLLPLRRKRRFALRAALSLGACGALSLALSALSAALPAPIGDGALLLALRECMLLLVLVLQSRFCVKGGYLQALYCAIWALITQQLSYELWRLLALLPGFPAEVWWLRSLWMGVVYVGLGLTAARWMPVRGEYHLGPRQTSLAVLMLGLFQFLNGVFLYLDRGTGLWRDPVLMRVVVAVAQVYCVTVFYFQNVLFQKSAMRQELTTLNLLWQQSRVQYSLSKENIDLINRKCHDLKHQMAALKSMTGSEERARYVAELENSIQIYDSIVKTGNEALDTILTEKSLYCEANHILISCVADGSRLGFINPVDIYAIFGNALSNAIESVQKITASGRRAIDVLVHVKRQFLVISITNPLTGELKFEDGLPVTTKPDNGYHGFGLKSIRHTAEKYGGFVTVEAKGGIFSLRILFPLP